jgi:hypothetical protein
LALSFSIRQPNIPIFFKRAVDFERLDRLTNEASLEMERKGTVFLLRTEKLSWLLRFAAGWLTVWLIEQSPWSGAEN